MVLCFHYNNKLSALKPGKVVLKYTFYHLKFKGDLPLFFFFKVICFSSESRKQKTVGIRNAGNDPESCMSFKL